MNAKSYLKILRPHQWIKNLMLLFPPFLGGTLLNLHVLGDGVIPLISFCLASSASYVFNDLCDRDRDSLHPTKKGRSIASGAVTPKAACVVIAILLIMSVGSALTVSSTFLTILVGYLFLSLLYSVKLKELPLLDIFCIATGFLIRLEGGGEAFGITISEWLFLSVFLLAIFLSTGKRLHEKLMLGDESGMHRPALAVYPAGFLEGTMYITGGAVLVTYTMYVITRHALVYSVPLCCFGLLRFIYRIRTGEGGDPTESLLRDRQLFIVGLVWTLLIGWTIYGGGGS